LNWKIVILSHWKELALIIQLSLIVLQVIGATPLGDPIDDSLMPG
jgi:hypothetical protein